MTIRFHDPHHPAPFRWAPALGADCPHVLRSPLIAAPGFYCTGPRDHDEDHAAEATAGTVAEWATGDLGDEVDESPATMALALARDVESAFKGFRP